MKILHNLHQQILFLLIKRIKQSLDHTFMKFSVITDEFKDISNKDLHIIDAIFIQSIHLLNNDLRVLYL